MIQFLNEYNHVCTTSFLNSKLAWWDQKALILPLWGNVTLSDDRQRSNGLLWKLLAGLKSVPGAIHSSAEWFRRLHLIQKVWQVREGMPFSAIIPWNSSSIFCLGQYLQRVNLGEAPRWSCCSQICEYPWKHSPTNSYNEVCQLLSKCLSTALTMYFVLR